MGAARDASFVKRPGPGMAPGYVRSRSREISRLHLPRLYGVRPGGVPRVLPSVCLSVKGEKTLVCFLPRVCSPKHHCFIWR